MTKATRTRYVIQHQDGTFLSIRGERKEDFMKVERWVTPSEIDDFLHGHYAPEHPEHYQAVPVTVTYELEELECNDQKPLELLPQRSPNSKEK